MVFQSVTSLHNTDVHEDPPKSVFQKILEEEPARTNHVFDVLPAYCTSGYRAMRLFGRESWEDDIAIQVSEKEYGRSNILTSI